MAPPNILSRRRQGKPRPSGHQLSAVSDEQKPGNKKAASVLAPILGERVSASTISRIARDLDHQVKFYHGRELGDKYQYLFFDGVVLKSKGAIKVQKKILLCAIGITIEGRHEIIDFHPAASESAACWGAFLRDLYQKRTEGQSSGLLRERPRAIPELFSNQKV